MSPTPNPPQRFEPIEPIIKLLTALVVFFVLLLIAVSKWSPNDGQTFQVVSGVLATFTGVLAGRINPMGKKDTHVVGTGSGEPVVEKPEGEK